ncbi:FadR/GntR family transcriptional regulator [Desulfobaculum sp.]
MDQTEMKKVLAFTPAQIGRASEDVALQIEAAITSGRIQPGEHLPSERELQSLFQTGRGVIREALRTLKQKGLIEIRKGAKGGAYIKQIEVDNVSESLALFLKQHSVAPDRIIEFRESIDRAITCLAISRATEEEKQQLVDGAHRLEKMLEAPNPDLNQLGELDRELNILLANMAHNPVFEWVMRALQSGFSSHDFALYEMPEYREATVSNWTDTAREIAQGETLRALSYIGHHYVLLSRCVEARSAEGRPGVTEFLDTSSDEATETSS